MVEESSHHYLLLQAAALRLSARAAAGARLTSGNSYNYREGDRVPEKEQGTGRDPEDILDPKADLTHGCLPFAMIVEETSHHYLPLEAAALRLSGRAAAGARLTSGNSYNHCEGDRVPEEEQGAGRNPEDILDPRAVLTHRYIPFAMVCSKEIRTRPGHPRSRAPNHR
ncbi:hypothetical protein MRX96_059022 [Rhipicephalus microplus]